MLDILFNAFIAKFQWTILGISKSFHRQTLVSSPLFHTVYSFSWKFIRFQTVITIVIFKSSIPLPILKDIVLYL